MTRQAIGENLAARLYAAETAIDLALIETAARADAYLSAITGRRAFDGAAGAVSALSAARSHVVQTHSALAALARKLGLDVLAAGSIDKPGDTPPRLAAAAAVETAAGRIRIWSTNPYRT